MRRILITVLFVAAVATAGIAAAAILVSPESATAEQSKEQVASPDPAVPENDVLRDRSAGVLEGALDRLVAEGVITGEQADAIREALGDELEELGGRLRERLSDRFGLFGEGPPLLGEGPLFGLPLEPLADALGIEVEHLLEMLRGALGDDLAEEFEGRGSGFRFFFDFPDRPNRGEDA